MVAPFSRHRTSFSMADPLQDTSQVKELLRTFVGAAHVCLRADSEASEGCGVPGFVGLAPTLPSTLRRRLRILNFD